MASNAASTAARRLVTGGAYLKPVGDFEVDLVDALHSVVESPRSLPGLQASLPRRLAFGHELEPRVAWAAATESGRGWTYQHGGILGSRRVVHDAQARGVVERKTTDASIG